MWLASTQFCAAMLPTVRSSLETAKSIRVMYQDPRFWSKEEAPLNILGMRITEETSQEPTGWLKEEAL